MITHGLLDPGDAVSALALLWVVQTSIVILAAAVLSRLVFGRRADVRHVLWFVVLLLVSVSPVVSAAAGEYALAIWNIPLPLSMTDKSASELGPSPGYSLRSPNAGGTEPLMVEVNNEADIVRDLALKGPARETYLSGVVIEKAPTGARPVAGATVFRLRVDFDGSYNPSRADDQGRFRMLRAPGEWLLYAVSAGLAGLMPFPTESDNVTLVVSKAPTITGRVIDSDGMPQVTRHVSWRIDSGPRFGTAAHFGSLTKTDEQGRFSLRVTPVGSQGELSVFHDKNPTSTAPRTVVRFEVPDSEAIVIPDLVIPAEKPKK